MGGGVTVGVGVRTGAESLYGELSGVLIVVFFLASDSLVRAWVWGVPYMLVYRMSGRGEVGTGGFGFGLATVLTGLKNLTLPDLVADWLLIGFLCPVRCEGAGWISEFVWCCLVPNGGPGGAFDFLALSQNC